MATTSFGSFMFVHILFRDSRNLPLGNVSKNTTFAPPFDVECVTSLSIALLPVRIICLRELTIMVYLEPFWQQRVLVMMPRSHLPW